MKKFLSGENLEVILILIGVVIAYNCRLLFDGLADQRVAFMSGVTLFGTPILLLTFYYRKLREIFSRTIILALIILAIKDLIGGISYLSGINFGRLFDNSSYGLSFVSQVAFILAILVVSYCHASRIHVGFYNNILTFFNSRSRICRNDDTEGNSHTEESVG